MDVLEISDAQRFLADRHIDQKTYERCEQLDALSFIPSGTTVLELGGRYGVVSCMINRILKNRKAHLVVEPDQSVIPYLEENRQNSSGEFSIFCGAVSAKKLKFNPLHTSSYTSETQGQDIPTASLKELESKYNLKFNVLVADCEGFFQNFVDENDLSQFSLILLEEDEPGRCNYAHCFEKMTEQGFMIAHRYFNDYYRSVHVNKRFLPFDIENFSSPLPPGFFGKLGSVFPQGHVSTEENILFLHPNSVLNVDLPRPLHFTLVSHEFSGKSYIDEAETTSALLLPGKHCLKIEGQGITGWKYTN